jgi:hypothetical protein
LREGAFGACRGRWWKGRYLGMATVTMPTNDAVPSARVPRDAGACGEFASGACGEFASGAGAMTPVTLGYLPFGLLLGPAVGFIPQP